MITGTTNLTLRPNVVPIRAVDVFAGQPVFVNNLSTTVVDIASDQANSNPVTLKAYSSVRWTRPGPVYVRVASGEIGNAEVTITTEASDISASPVDIAVQTALQLFASGVPSIDVPEILFAKSTTNLNAADSFNTGNLDCRKFSSFFSKFRWDIGNDVVLKVDFFWRDDAGNLIDRDTFYVSDQNGTLLIGVAYIRGPVRGTQVQVAVENQAGIAGDYEFTIYGSLRNVQGVRAYEDDGNTPYNAVYTDGQITPGGGVGVNVTILLPLWSGPTMMTVLPVGTAAQTVRIQVYERLNTGSFLFDKTYTIAAVLTPDVVPLFFPRMPVNVRVTNGGAGAGNGIRLAIYAQEPQ